MRRFFTIVFFFALLGAAYSYGVATGAYQLFPFEIIVSLKDTVRDAIKGTEAPPPKAAEQPPLRLSPKIAAYADQFALLPTRSAEVVFLGDSLTQGGQFAERFPDKSVVNRGIGGDTTAGVLLRVDDVIRLRPAKVFLMIGINDIVSDYDVAFSKQNIRSVLQKLDSAGIQVLAQSILYTNPDKVVRDVWNKPLNAKVTILNDYLKSISSEFASVVFVDLNAALSEDGVLKGDYTYDGIHLTGKGYEAWWRGIERLVIE